MRCHNCGSTRTETDPSTGTTFCIQCGGVLEENNIVAEVTFAELSGGKTVLQGAFAGESGRIASGGPFGHGRGKEGQEQAIDNGRHRIARLAHGLKLPERYREAAQRYYNLAVVNRFTRGRKSDHVAAVCLYVVCRNEQSSQMLIDFSDLLQTNVFVLGSTFLKLVRVLCLKLPLIDPSIYISRFAAACDFGEYTQRVAQDAVRLVQRMDRDWIRTGRRPAGICGACLLIAARINGFKRSVREMIYVVRVGDQTIQKRLREFGDTESAKLSVKDFRDIWLETECDPPAFLRNRHDNDRIKEEVVHDQAASSTVSSPSIQSIQNAVAADAAAVAAAQSVSAPVSPTLEGSTLVEPNTQLQTQDLDATQVERDADGQPIAAKSEMIAAKSETIAATLSQKELDAETEKLELEMEDFMQDAIKASEALAEEREDAEDGQVPPMEELSLSDVDDPEIEAMILTPDEVEIKSLVWYNANKDYLEEMAAKQRKIEMDRKNGVYPRRKPGKRKRMLETPNTPAEAAKQLFQTRKISKKINQAVFDDMFETPETIAKIKEMDRRRDSAVSAAPAGGYEIVEESGDLPPPQPAKEEQVHSEDEDDEEMDVEDMAEDEALLRKAREQFDWIATGEDFDEHGYDDDY
ncbi:hypothetical protein BC940DRAFT_250460 [Gongronella butleri]|nr:hypothetical protein BC940DRAFT_250460 [Gongronella butleri]